MSELSERSSRRLASRVPLEVDPGAGIAVKRNVHEFVVDAPADRFASAFHDVMIEPDAEFGRIQIKRAPGRSGKPFEPGERFHGCFRIGISVPALRPLLARGPFARAADWLEDAVLSDYAEIVELVQLVDRGGGFTATYRYLSGSPIAGFSTFTVVPDGARSRMTAVFQYQEIGSLAIFVLQRMAAKFHDDVLVEQVRRAAARAGGRIVSSTLGEIGP